MYQHSTALKELDEFFSAATEEQDGYGLEEKATAQQYRDLVAALKQHLNNLKVYQLGEVNIDIYIVGKTKVSELVVLATRAVET